MPKITPISIHSPFILGCFFLLIGIFVFVFYKRQLRETFSGISNTTFFYIPDLTDVSYQVLTTDVSLNISKIKHQEKTSMNRLIKEAVDMITFYESVAGIEMAGDFKKKYELDAPNTDLYKKMQKIKETHVEDLNQRFNAHFSRVEEKTLREFNEKIRPYNYAMNAVCLHVSLDGKQTIGGKNAMSSYFLKKMAEYRGNTGQLADLKTEFYATIQPGDYIRAFLNEYLNNAQFYQTQTDISLLLTTVKDELMRLRENATSEGNGAGNWINPPIAIKIYQYLEICNSFWHFLLKCEETKENMKDFLVKYEIYKNGNPMFFDV